MNLAYPVPGSCTDAVTIPADEKFSKYWRFSEPKAPLNREKNMQLNKHRNAALALVTFAGLT